MPESDTLVDVPRRISQFRTNELDFEQPKPFDFGIKNYLFPYLDSKKKTKFTSDWDSEESKPMRNFLIAPYVPKGNEKKERRREIPQYMIERYKSREKEDESSITEFIKINAEKNIENIEKALQKTTMYGLGRKKSEDDVHGLSFIHPSPKVVNNPWNPNLGKMMSTSWYQDVHYPDYSDYKKTYQAPPPVLKATWEEKASYLAEKERTEAWRDYAYGLEAKSIKDSMSNTITEADVLKTLPTIRLHNKKSRSSMDLPGVTRQFDIGISGKTFTPGEMLSTRGMPNYLR